MATDGAYLLMGASSSLQLLTAKLSQSNAAAPGSPDSSSDSSAGGSPQHAANAYGAGGAVGAAGAAGAALSAAAAENLLPGVLMSRDAKVTKPLCSLVSALLLRSILAFFFAVSFQLKRASVKNLPTRLEAVFMAKVLALGCFPYSTYTSVAE